MEMFWLVARRSLFLVPQLFMVSIVTFLLLRLLPGNPAEAILGPFATDSSVAKLEADMGLNGSLPEQYLRYLGNVLEADLGHSWFTGQPVLTDLLERVPATIELVVTSLLISVAVGVSVGTLAAQRRKKRGAIAALLRTYNRLAGAFPDFWFALMAIYVFFFELRWTPAPMGRLGATTEPPADLTGLYILDSVLTGNWASLGEAIAHLALPALVLGLVLAPSFARVTQAALADVLESDFMKYARAYGLSSQLLVRYAIRNAFPPILTMIAIRFVYLLGGAVLIEKVFAWGGVGQYAVAAVQNADYAPILGFVLLTAVTTLLVYLVVDLLHMAIDPRVRRGLLAVQE